MKMSHKSGLSGAAILAFGALATPAVQAQSIDRAAFEALFGEPVTTSATGAPQRASDVPVAMIIITGDELRRSGARNLAQALRGHAGIDVNEMTAQNSEVAVRGGNQPINPRLLVMVNGRQVYLDHYGVTSWSNLGIELSEIRQIEVVKGPVSALFGFNAASGAINIITYDPLSEVTNVVSGEVGNGGRIAVSAVGTTQLGQVVGLRLSGGYAVQDEFDAIGPVDEHGPQRLNLALDAHVMISSKVDGRLNVSLTESTQNALGPGFNPLGMHYLTKGGMGELSAETDAGLMSLSVQYSNLTHAYEIVPSDGIDHAFDANLYAVKLQDIIKAGARDTIRATLEFRVNDLTMTPDLGGRIQYHIYSAGLMWDRRLSSDVTVNMAGRVDRLDRSQSGDISPLIDYAQSDFDDPITEWSANAALLVKTGAHSTMRLQAARGVQAPSLISTGIALMTPVAPGLALALSGNPKMAPTITESAELGFSRDLPAWEGKFTATAFYAKTRDVAEFVQGTPIFSSSGVLVPASFANHGGYESYGLEATLSGEFDPELRWQLDYTFNALDGQFAPGTTAIAAPYEALTPRHKIGAALSATRGAWSFDLRGLLRSQVSFPANGRISDWTVGLDGRLGYRLDDQFELYAAGENLTGSDFIGNGYVRQSTRVRLGLRVTG